MRLLTPAARIENPHTYAALPHRFQQNESPSQSIYLGDA